MEEMKKKKKIGGNIGNGDVGKYRRKINEETSSAAYGSGGMPSYHELYFIWRLACDSSALVLAVTYCCIFAALWDAVNSLSIRRKEPSPWLSVAPGAFT